MRLSLQGTPHPETEYLKAIAALQRNIPQFSEKKDFWIASGKAAKAGAWYTYHYYYQYLTKGHKQGDPSTQAWNACPRLSVAKNWYTISVLWEFWYSWWLGGLFHARPNYRAHMQIFNSKNIDYYTETVYKKHHPLYNIINFYPISTPMQRGRLLVILSQPIIHRS